MKIILKNLALLCLILWFPVKSMAQNTPPEVTRIEILPENATLDDDLTCDYDYYDADGDPEDTSQRFVAWQRNGVWQTEFRDQLTVPASATEDNEKWEVFLRVHDGTEESVETYTASVEFGTPIPNTQPEAQDVEILPSNPTTNDDLNLSYTYYDADGDPEDESQRFIAWRRNGEWTHIHRDLLTVPAADTREGEVWECELRVHDGKDESIEYWADPVTIGNGNGNTPPEASDLSLTPTDPDESDDLIASYTYSDADGDPESGTEIRWYNDSVLQPDYNDQLSILASATSGGEEWYFTVHPSDGVDFGGLQTSHTVTISGTTYELQIAVLPAEGGTTVPEVGIHTYEAGEDVIIEAIPAEGYRFVIWTGNVAYGIKPLTYVTMSSDQSVTANFEPIPTYNLTMQVSPQGSGTTEPSVGNHTYSEGTDVNITATPVTGYEFVNWTGDVADTNDPTTTITITTDELVTANFRTTQEVISTPTVPEGPDSGYKMQLLEFTTGGSVSNKDHEVEYQFDWNDGSLSDWGIALKSHAYSDTGMYHVKSRARCKVHTNVMSGWSATHAVTISACSLTISINPSDAGSVIKNPDKSGYDYGDTISITATPITGWKFIGWTGDHSGNNNPAIISIRNNMSITANFEQKTYTLTMHVIPSGTGNIIKSPDKAKYTHGEVVVCTAIANPDSFYKFDHWSGDITDTVKSASLIMDRDKNITAHFSIMDIMPPHLVNCYPPAGATETPKNVNIQFTLKDNAYGINLNSVQVFINETQIINNGVDRTGGDVYINPDKGNYHIKYTPQTEFPEKSNVIVQVKFSNLPGITCDSSYTFDVGSSKITTTAVDTISLLGGTLFDSTNHVGINIPAGALEEPTEILIALVETLPTLPDSVKGIGVAYYFGPAGLKFNYPITLHIPYSQKDLDEAHVDDPMQLSIYYYSMTKGNWINLTNLGADTTNNLIYCQVDEFGYLTLCRKTVTSVSDLDIYGIIPSEFALMQNYPNPFNPETIIRYQIPHSSRVRLEVFNILGERIRTLMDTEQQSGYYQVIWNGKNDMGAIVPSGIYFYVLRWDNNMKFGKAIFMK